MLFFKFKPLSRKNDATKLTEEPVTKQAPASAPSRALHHNDNGKGAASVSFIREIKDIPEGRNITDEVGIPSDWKRHFALIGGRGKVVNVLVSDSMYGSVMMFDLVRRLGSKDIGKHRVFRASEDIIHLIHDREKDQEQSSLGQKDVTDVEKKARALIDAAIEAGASDIHIETRDMRADVFFRIHGTRHFHANFSMDTARSLGVVLYSVHADASSKDVTWDAQQVMDAVIDHVTQDGRAVQLRFSSAPIHPSGNFHIVIRLLVMNGSDDKDLGVLGYEDDQLKALDTMITGSSGMVILCGPTNSGKSTTLQAMMRRIYERRGDTIKMISVEDPVEYVIPGACQIGVARKRKITMDEATGSVFTTFLRGTLRQDPDVVMVGEIRDHDSAAVVKDLVLAGRKLLTTLHTYSAMWSFIRLREIGVPMSLLTMPGFISGIVYQRLVPTLCPHCSIPLTDSEGMRRLPPDVLARVQYVVDLDTYPVRVKGDGCTHCHHTGISGRTPCAEFVLPDSNILKMIADDQYIKAQEYWLNAGVLSVDGLGVTALAHAIAKMRRGMLDPLDVEHQVGILTQDQSMSRTTAFYEKTPVLSGLNLMMK